MKIFLLCTNHSNQMIGYKDSNSENLMYYLSRVCLEKGDIDLIAEELSDEALNLWKAKDSACRVFAQSMKLKHLYCDPNTNERNILGIESEKDIRKRLGFGRLLTTEQDNQVQLEEIKNFPVREKYWLENLLSLDFENCIFVFGKSHYVSFSKLLSSNGILFEELNRDWQS